MNDIMTIGSATVDIFMKSADFHLQPTEAGVLLCQEYGGKLDIDQFQMAAGGAGTNTAVGFSRLGFKTAAVVEIGQDLLGQFIWDDLKREQVVTDFVITEKKEQTAVSVLLISGDGGRSALTHRGASAQLEARDLPWDHLSENRWIHLSNISGNTELLFMLFDHLRGSQVGLSWNPGHKELELMVEGKIKIEQIVADILVMNKEEWAMLVPVQTQILAHLPQVIITDGKEGGKLFLKGSYQFDYQSLTVKVAQETGAGDAFITGYVAAHLSGKNPVECCQWGVQNSASVVQKMDAKEGLLTKKEMEIKLEHRI